MSHALYNVVIQPSLTVTTGSAYASGYGVGGILSLAGALDGNRGAGMFQSLTVGDFANQKAPLSLLLFSAQPAGGSYTDHAALSLSTTDLANCLGIFNVTAANYQSIGTVAVATLSNLCHSIFAKAANLYGLLLTTGTPTYAHTTDLKLTLGFQQN